MGSYQCSGQRALSCVPPPVVCHVHRVASAWRSSSADLTTAYVRAHAYMRSCVHVCALAGVTVISGFLADSGARD